MTKRERLHPVIVQMRADGKLFREIAAELGLSVSTVQDYVDPTGEKVRARKAKGVRACLDCGGPCNTDGRRAAASQRCRPCARNRSKTDLAYRREVSVRNAGRIRWSDDDIVDALRSLVTNGRLSAREYDAATSASPGRFPVRRTVEARFGGRWNDALTAAGIAIVKPKAKGWGIGRDGALRAVQDCAHDLGRLPTSGEYDAWAKRTGAPSLGGIRFGAPSLGGIRFVYGSWQAAVEACDREMTREAVAA